MATANDTDRAYQNGYAKGLRDGEVKFEQVMELLRHMRKEHGLYYPRERRACTHCNAREELEKLVIAWKGPKIYPS